MQELLLRVIIQAPDCAADLREAISISSFYITDREMVVSVVPVLLDVNSSSSDTTSRNTPLAWRPPLVRWRVGGGGWRSRLEEEVGGAGWRSRLEEEVGGAGRRSRLEEQVRGAGRRSGPEERAGGAGRRSGLKEQVGGAGRRSRLEEQVGGAGWRSRLKEQVGGAGRRSRPEEQAGGAGRRSRPEEQAGGAGRRSRPEERAAICQGMTYANELKLHSAPCWRQRARDEKCLSASDWSKRSGRDSGAEEMWKTHDDEEHGKYENILAQNEEKIKTKETQVETMRAGLAIKQEAEEWLRAAHAAALKTRAGNSPPPRSPPGIRFTVSVSLNPDKGKRLRDKKARQACFLNEMEEKHGKFFGLHLQPAGAGSDELSGVAGAPTFRKTDANTVGVPGALLALRLHAVLRHPGGALVVKHLEGEARHHPLDAQAPGAGRVQRGRMDEHRMLAAVVQPHAVRLPAQHDAVADFTAYLLDAAAAAAATPAAAAAPVDGVSVNPRRAVASRVVAAAVVGVGVELAQAEARALR
ncbi:hypothetical protein EYF80_037532 [Liparis tanakae]|uniref:Uncharacterized protein n=1 Tax=Liparis tanakae TaxID=230148 RepID=A0A4Z2GFE9_9TELE|nr:hypothetical protein EYF80_037532 [Liparis tanakae]